MKFDLLPVRPGGAHPGGSVDGLVGGGGEDEQLVPLVRQQLGVDVHGKILVERQSAGPLDEFVHDRVSDLAQLLLKVSRVLVQELANILEQGKIGDYRR